MCVCVWCRGSVADSVVRLCLCVVMPLFSSSSRSSAEVKTSKEALGLPQQWMMPL